MSYTGNYQARFASLDDVLRNSDQIVRKANGGNSILFSYLPEKEQEYISGARQHYNDQSEFKAEFIDISKLLVTFIDRDGWEDFSAYYSDMKPSHIVFKSDDPEEDLFDLIIQAIKTASANGRIPFLIRSGCLYGTGIENVNIMEHRDVMSLQHPLVIFYPSAISEDNIHFLNFKPASKYRCTLVM